MPQPVAPAERSKRRQEIGAAEVVVEYDDFIQQQIEQTRSSLRTADVLEGTLWLLLGGIVFFLAVALLEHWLVPSGFSFWARLLLLGLAILAVGVPAARRVGRAIWRSINPVYAAVALESASPSLKNSLVNLLLLQRREGGAPQVILEELESEAAQRLAQSHGESAVDRAHIVRLGWVVLAVAALAAAYSVLSPKSPLLTAQRVLMPWAELPTPSRVQITKVAPGDTQLLQGDPLEVSAEVAGLRPGEQPVVVFSSGDGRFVEERAPASSGNRTNQVAASLFEAVGTGGQGVQSEITYRIEAGDARTRDYRVVVRPAPTIAVTKVQYEYPRYTGFLDRAVSHGGDIRAIEGTYVTIEAIANRPIAAAHLDFEADGRPDLRMQVEGERATVRFPLALRDDRRTPKHASYVIRYTTSDGDTNNDPAKHLIDVTPDYSPEVELAAPMQPELVLRPDEPWELVAEARDPDFALREVQLRWQADDGSQGDLTLLSEPFTGKWSSRRQLTPSDMGLGPGDGAAYWLEASDNREPQPNRARSERRRLRVLDQPEPGAPPEADPNEPQPGQGEQGGQAPNAGQAAEDRQEPSGESGDAPRPDDASEQGQPEGDGQPNGGMQGPGQGEAADGTSPDPSAGGPGESADSDERTDGDTQPSAPQQGGGGAGTNETDTEQRGNQEGDSQPEDGLGDTQPGRDQREDGQAGQDSTGRGDPQDGRREGDTDATPPPVPSDGQDDGAAFERIRKYLEESNDGSTDPASQSDDAPADAAPPDAAPPGDPQSSPSQRSRGDARPRETGDQPDAAERDPSDASAAPGDPNASEQKSDSQNSEQGDALDSPREGGDRQEPREGTGSPGENQAADQGQGQSADEGSGDQTGRPGAMEPSAEPTGRPGDATATDGEQGSAQRPAEGDPRESPEQPDTEETPSTPEDSGATRPGASDSGSGEQSPNDAPAADDAQGESPSDSGSPADGTQPSDEGSAGGQPSEVANGEPSGAPSDPSARPSDSDGRSSETQDPTQRDASPAEGAAGAEPGGFGQPRDTGPSAGSPDTEPGGDAANLEYARKQTELVLDRLSEQLERQEVDRRLLEQLGWTEDDLRAFVDRWNRRRQATSTTEASEQGSGQEFDEALRALGIRRTPASAEVQLAEDADRNLRQGPRAPAPPSVRERLRAYTQGISRSPGEP
jgi:hypothetical protein